MKCFDCGTTTVRILVFGMVAGIVGTTVSGCPSSASSSSKMTKQEEANFKGGPMPADFKPNAGQGPPKGVTPK